MLQEIYIFFFSFLHLTAFDGPAALDLSVGVSIVIEVKDSSKGLISISLSILSVNKYTCMNKKFN